MEFPSPHDHVLPGNIRCVAPPLNSSDNELKNRIRGSMLGLATGDAVGASVEFMPHEYLLKHPIRTLQGGGTWGLKAGQWTDDTSMALCLASSLISTKRFDPYNQMVRYKWWYKHGFLSSTGSAFDIGKATRAALDQFMRRQKVLQQKLRLSSEAEVDHLSYQEIKHTTDFDVNCSSSDAAGNGALMRLAPIPLFFFRNPTLAVELCGRSAQLTHSSILAIDACRYYGALMVAALHGEGKDQLLSEHFYKNHRHWFGKKNLCSEVLNIALGSYKKPRGYDMGIRGAGFVINSLEAALWAFWSDTDSFKNGILNAVNLGDDTDTTAAIYGQLAGAYYGATNIKSSWLKKLYAKNLIICISDWLLYLGQHHGLAIDAIYRMAPTIPTMWQQRPLMRFSQNPNSISNQGMSYKVADTPGFYPLYRAPEPRRRYGLVDWRFFKLRPSFRNVGI